MPAWKFPDPSSTFHPAYPSKFSQIMSANSDHSDAAEAAAEEILRTIYGDDFKGCSVRLETIATIVASTLKERDGIDAEMLDLYRKAVEALHLLSTPPASATQLAPQGLPALLGERLDAIHNLTQKLIDTAAAVHSKLTVP